MDSEDESKTRNETYEQDLIRLKYVLFKNMSTIQSRQNADYSRALEFLIEAAKIDDTDRCIWYEIGQNALNLNKYMIARYAFEHTLSIDPNDWYSLDNLIVILYALGNYSQCLSYVFHALKVDKFYVNGLIVMKLMEKLGEVYYTRQVEMFSEANFTMCGIDVDEFLSQLDEELYDSFLNRVDTVKTNYKSHLFEISNNKGEYHHVDVNLEVKVGSKICRLILELLK
jgi:tetratricopeptide (TPR) repeat protein